MQRWLPHRHPGRLKMALLVRGRGHKHHLFGAGVWGWTHMDRHNPRGKKHTNTILTFLIPSPRSSRSQVLRRPHT
jgi:hypothetical protein